MGKEGRDLLEIFQKLFGRIGGLGLLKKILEKRGKRSTVRIEPFALCTAFEEMGGNAKLFFTGVFERFLDQNTVDGVGSGLQPRVKSLTFYLFGCKRRSWKSV